MPKCAMGSGVSMSLIEALGVSATQRETAQTNECIPYLFLYTTFIMADCSGGMVTTSIRARLVRPHRVREDCNRMLMNVNMFQIFLICRRSFVLSFDT